MDAPSYEQLLRENQQLRELVAQLQQTIRDLQRRLDEAERSAKRQAAPFSKGEPKKNPKKPGRKKGKQHGDHAHRESPLPERVDETLDAPLPDQCPDCGGDVVDDHLDQQFQTEIPRQPIVREFKIHCGHCQKCGKHLRGRHPLQTSDATGAAQSQLGGDAQAAIVYLNKRAGMSHGKIADTFDKFFGVTLTRGACAQVIVPDQILVVVVAKLTLYGFWCRKGCFAELLRILENDAAARWCCRISATNLAMRRGVGRSVHCAGPNCGRSCCRINAVLISGL